MPALTTHLAFVGVTASRMAHFLAPAPCCLFWVLKNVCICTLSIQKYCVKIQYQPSTRTPHDQGQLLLWFGKV